MGLGKTLTMISLLAHDRVLKKDLTSQSPDGNMLGRGTLIVLPPSCESFHKNNISDTNKRMQSDAKLGERAFTVSVSL
jgi:hypothetical protein